MDNEKYFKTTTNETYDWKRVNEEVLFKKGEEEPRSNEKPKRSFVHPVTKTIHPVPYEWEEDIVMEKQERIRKRHKQMDLESDIVLNATSN